MKVVVKTLKSVSKTVDIEPEDKVSLLKTKIEEAFSVPIDCQKLIVAGKIITDPDATVGSYGINEKSFIILMEKKPEAAKPEPPKLEPAQTAPAVPSGAAAVPAPVGVSEDAIANLMGMGFPRSECEAALRAAFGNADRAVEYLLNGIPASAQPQEPPRARVPSTGAAPAPAPVAGGAAAGGAPASGAPAGGAAAADDLFGDGTGGAGMTGLGLPAAGGSGSAEEEAAFSQIVESLASDENFQQLALLINSNPSVLSEIIPAITRSNPRLGQLFAARPQLMTQVVQRVVERVGPEGVAAFNAVNAAEMGPGMGMGGAGGVGAPAPGVAPPARQEARSIFGEELTDDDKAAIGRLCDLGFERAMVIQAYVACGKNEMAAANFLLENGGF